MRAYSTATRKAMRRFHLVFVFAFAGLTTGNIGIMLADVWRHHLDGVDLVYAGLSVICACLWRSARREYRENQEYVT